MTITVNELSLQAINAALLRIQRSIQTGNNNFQSDVEKAVANVTISGKTVIQKYDDSRLMAIVNELNQRYETLTREQSSLRSKIVSLETILSNVSLAYDTLSNTISYTLGDYSTNLQLKDTTYTFSYDTDTGTFTIVDEYTGETVFNQVFNDTTYTFSFTNGILTVHNNRLNTDQTFNFDSRYYTEAEIQSLILDKIPPEASSSNQLADKAFVNSSISTATATFRGTVTTTTALAALTGDLNDYAYLQNIDSTTGQTISYDRYKWVESGGDYGHWKYEYTLNNSSFTSDQWAAINSGITCQIVTDLLDGCYSGNGSALCKSNGNEWRNLLSTNCDCTGSVNADYIYYNTNIQANQCTGALLANCYCVKGHGRAAFAACDLTASSIGLTAQCCYPLTCILECIMACKGYSAGTYTFSYAIVNNPTICETNGSAYCAVFTKEDSYNPVVNIWQLTRWRITFNDGRSYCASAYSTDSAGIKCWVVCGINFSYICNATALNKAANTVTRRIIANEQIGGGVGYRTRVGLGLCRGTTGWSKALLSVGCNDAGTSFWDYCFDNSGHIGNACVVKTCVLGSAGGTKRYVQIKTLANRANSSVSFDFDLWSMNGIINLDITTSTSEYTGACYGCLQVAKCNTSCTNCDCFWLTYNGYRSLVLKSNYEFEVLCNTTTAPTGITFNNLSYSLGTVCKVAAGEDASYNLLMSCASNDTRIAELGSSSDLTFNPNTGILNVICGTCVGWNRTKSICVKITPTEQSSCWIYIGRFQTNGTGDTINTYNELNLTIAAIGVGMVSSTNIKVLSANATAPTVIVQRQCGYSSSTGIDCVAVTRNGSTWNCYTCVWARVKSCRTNAYYVHLYRNMLPDTWTTALTVCSAITGDIVGVGNADINTRAIQSNVPLRIGCLACCTSSITGCSGSIYGPGYQELYGGTPYIDFHTNHYCGDYSNRIISNSNGLVFCTSNGTGCTAATKSTTYTMCSNGVLYVNRGFAAGTCSGDCSFASLDCTGNGRMLTLSKVNNTDVGLLLAHCADYTGTTYCNLGIEIGSGNVNRGFYHCKAGTFQWLQFWDTNTERHTCPQCFQCSIYGCSDAIFACTVTSRNTERWGSLYNTTQHNSGYYLIAQFGPLVTGQGNHDITLGGKVDAYPTAVVYKTWCFKAFVRGSKCTFISSCVFVDSDEAADWLCFTRDIDTTTCALTLRVYARVAGYYSRYNTTIDYLAGCDVGERYGLNSSCLTFPNTYAADTSAFVGALITPTNANSSWKSVYSGCRTITPQCQYFIMKAGPINASTVEKLDFLLCTSVDGTSYPSKICGTLIPGNAGTNAYNPDLIKASFTSTRCALYPLSIGFDSTCCLVFAFAYQCGCTFRPQLFFKCDQFNKVGSINVSFLCCANDTTNYRTYVMANMSCQCDSGMFVTAVNANQVSANCLSTYSKRSLKKDITPYMGCALNLIGNTNVVSYRYKTESENSLVHIGFIADDTPELLSGENKDTMRINDSVGILLKAVQELDERTLPFWKKITNKVRKLIRRFRNGKKD